MTLEQRALIDELQIIVDQKRFALHKAIYGLAMPRDEQLIARYRDELSNAEWQLRNAEEEAGTFADLTAPLALALTESASAAFGVPPEKPATEKGRSALSVGASQGGAAGAVPDDESVIWREFIHGEMKYLDAIERLVTLGYPPKEAERIVNEWIDGEEADRNEDA